MAISSNTVFEVRTGGSDNNGGGFVTGASGTDYSQQNAAQYALTTVTTAAANAICLSASAAADMVGNIVNIISGTNFTPGLYQVISVSVGVSFTLDRTCTTAAGSGGTMNIGGAFASPGKAAAAATVNGNLIWVKAGTYTLTTSTPGAGGPIVPASAIRMKMEGYTTTRGDRAGRPVVSAGAVTSVNIFSGNGGAPQQFVHLQADGNSKTGVTGFLFTAGRHGALDCSAVHCNQASAIGFSVTTSPILNVIRCSTSDCTTGFANSATGSAFNRCWADQCAVGFSTSAVALYHLCAATRSTGDGFITSIAACAYIGCTADANGDDGFDVQFDTRLDWCASTNNTHYGYNTAAGVILEGCASYLNGTARTNVAPLLDTNPILLSGTPYAGSGDVNPNNNAGAGAALRNAGGGVSGQTDNRDVGAVQHADPAGGGSLLVNPGMTGGMHG